MEIIYATVLGMAIGAVLRYALPGRGHYGMLLLPAIGAVAGALVWTAATWLGWKPGGGWIWGLAIVAPALISAASIVLITRARTAIDERMLERLSSGRAA